MQMEIIYMIAMLEMGHLRLRSTEDPQRCDINASRQDSDLEAFGNNPSEGSFTPNTYTNPRFLSYRAGLLLQQHIISSVTVWLEGHDKQFIN